MEPTRGESRPLGQRRGPAAPGEDRVSSPDYKSLRISTTPTTQGRRRTSPGSIPPRRVWKPQPHWMVADWLRVMEPARGQSCTSGQRQRPAAPGEDKVLSPDEKSLNPCSAPTSWGRKQRSPGSTPPRALWKPQPHWVITYWLGLMVPARGGSCPSGKRQGPACGVWGLSSPDNVKRAVLSQT